MNHLVCIENIRKQGAQNLGFCTSFMSFLCPLAGSMFPKSNPRRWHSTTFQYLVENVNEVDQEGADKATEWNFDVKYEWSVMFMLFYILFTRVDALFA